jgi:hypothetical protein
MESWPDWVQHTIAISLGGIAVIVILWRLSPLLFFRFRAITVEGRISNWMSMKEKGVAYYYPLIEFNTIEGRHSSYRADDRCEGRPMYPIGTVVKVSYDPKDLKNVRTTYPEQLAKK